MKKDYLPSKQFITRIAILAGLVILSIGINALIRHFSQNNNNQVGLQVGKIGDLIQKDSNNNGIADWEEYLWGLDPKKNGEENKKYILAKKESLNTSNSTKDDELLTDNDLLSVEFFAAIISLQQTGQLDETSMKSISEAIGKNVQVTDIPDIYTREMLHITEDTTETHQKYKNDIISLIKKYSDRDIGSELTFIVQGLSHNDNQALYAAHTVALAYKSFGKDFLEIEVPRALISNHLKISNNYEKVGETIDDLTKILENQIIGMKALLNYKKYSDTLSTELDNLTEILQ